MIDCDDVIQHPVQPPASPMYLQPAAAFSSNGGGARGGGSRVPFGETQPALNAATSSREGALGLTGNRARGFSGEVEEKIGEQNFRVLSEMRILAKIRVVIFDFVGYVEILCEIGF